MSQRRRKAREFDLEFKVETVKRLLKGERVSAVSKELDVLRKDLYLWKKAYQRGGETLLRGRGRPRRQMAQDAEKIPELDRARKRIEQLERKIGQQELELDFFAKALRCVESTGKPMPERSVISLKRKPRKAN